MIVLGEVGRGAFSAVAVHPEGKLVAAGGKRAPVIWDLTTGREIPAPCLDPFAPTTALAFHPTRPLLYIVTEIGVTAHSLDTREDKPLQPRPYFTYGAAFHPTGDRIVYGHYRDHDSAHLCGHFLNCAVRSAAGNYRRVWQRCPVDAPEDGWATCFAFFPDGERFAQAEVSAPGFRFTGPRVVVRSADTGDALHQLPGPCDGIAVSPCNDILVTRLRNLLYVSDAGDFTARPRKVVTGTRRLVGIAFHRSGRYLAATSNDATVKLYDTTSWEVAKTYTWNVGRMRSVAFSPDGTLAAAGSDTGKVVVWDVDV